MARWRPRGQSVDTDTAIELSELAAAVSGAVLDAKVRLDQEAAAVTSRYKANSALRLMSPPAFAIGEVRVLIKFAIAQVEQPEEETGPSPVRVHITAASLAEIAPDLLSEIELRIAPEKKRTQPTENESESPG